jgi:tetratricopeptide (TPR) repeat protein
MNKISITLLAAVLMITGIHAQTVADGINDLYAERTKSAKATFEKLIAANPNNIDANYWMGQTYIAMKDIPGAREVYAKALMASANAPLLIVGMGQVELNEKKFSEATQRFETAITLTTGKKGSDPVILNAVGRAIVNTYTDKDKIGDINYAIDKLEAAAAKDPANADIFLNLGMAYLKAKPGEGGSKAYENFNKAITANPNFAISYFRMAKLFESQKNWELYEKFLNDAITKDPRFAPAYYELSYYKMGRKDLAAAEMYAQRFKENSDPDPQNAYLEASIKWAAKNFDQAISMSKDIIGQAGANAKAPTFKLIADAMVQKGDTAGARQYIDQYFVKADPEKVTALDYGLKALIYSAIPGQEDVLYATYLEGVKADTIIDNKVELLRKGAAYFRGKGMREKEGDLLAVIIQIRPKTSLNDMFDATRAYYFGQAYQKSLDMAAKMLEKFPTEVYGYDWTVNNYKILDSSYAQNKLIPATTALFEFAQKDTAKFRKQYMSSAGLLMGYYANEAKDKDKAVEYVDKMLYVDPDNESLQKIKKDLLNPPKQPNNPPKKNPPKTGNSSSINNSKQPAVSNNNNKAAVNTKKKPAVSSVAKK